MAVQKTKYEHIELSDHPDEPLPAYSTTWGRDGVQDSARPKRRGTIPWALAMDSTKQRAQTIAQNTPSYLRHTAWPALKKIRFTKIQFYAFCLVAIFGIAPLIIIGQVTSLNPTQAIPDRPFFWVFAAKTLSCGYAFGTPQNSTVSGWEALFVLDATFGKLPFSQVKTVDVAWDLLVGRGVQLLAWWASYKVFSNALLRVIERHPSSYQTFAHICLEGPCMASMWALIKDLGRIKSKRTWFLYFYMILSIIYTLCIPLFLSAMTGYINNTVAWVDIDSTENLIPAANFKYSYLVYNVGNTTFDQTCEAGDEIKQFKEDWNRRSYSCDCKLPNGTVVLGAVWRSTYYYSLGTEDEYRISDCNFHFSNNTDTFSSVNGKTYQCNDYWNITIQGHEYDVDTVNYTSAYCIEDKGYPAADMYDKSRCLPDTANDTYQWGFSSMLSGVWIILNFSWVLTMYAVWLDAQFYSELVKSGYAMTQLRAAFTLATAARWRTGMGSRELVRTDTKELELQLYGSKTKNRAEVGWDIFRGELKDEERSADGEGLRRRDRRISDSDE